MVPAVPASTSVCAGLGEGDRMQVRDQILRMLRIQDLVLETQAARAVVDGAPGRVDEIVKAALKKWPNVPHCYGWLALDARGDGLRDGVRYDGLWMGILREEWVEKNSLIFANPRECKRLAKIGGD